MRHWAKALLARRPEKYGFKLTAVALANKLARLIFALMSRGGVYEGQPIAA